METIKVYADFDFLEQKEQVGELSYERLRGGDHFAFQFSREWLKRHGDLVLSGDIMNVYVAADETEVNLLYIYDKSERSTVSAQEIVTLLIRMG